MGFHEVRFPTNISFGSQGGPRFKTHIFESFRGKEFRNSEWQQPRMVFDVAYGVRTDEDILELLDFFNARQGRLNGFRYKNWGNYSVDNDVIAIGDGTSDALPLIKRVGPSGSAISYDKRLRKIVHGTPSLIRLGSGGAVLTEGTDFHIDYNSGEIAFATPPADGQEVWGMLEFDEPVRFDEDSISNIIEGFNNNSLSLKLIGVRGEFDSGTVVAPNAAQPVDAFEEETRLIANFNWEGSSTATTDDSYFVQTISLVSDAIVDPTQFVSGSGSLSAGSGYAEVDGEFFDLHDRAFTVEATFQVPTTGPTIQYVAGQWHSTTSRGWALRYDIAQNLIEFVVSTDGSDEIIVIRTYFKPHDPSEFVSVSVDHTNEGWFALRIDGTVFARTLYAPVRNETDRNLTIGGLSSYLGGEGALQGNIDFVRVTQGRSRYGDGGSAPTKRTTVPV